MHKGIILPGIILILIVLTGTLIYHNLEGWRYIDSLYFSVMTMTTIGYGDYSPATDIGKIFTIFYAFMAIGIAFYFFTLIGRYFLILQKRESLDDLRRLNGSKGVRRYRK